MDLDCSSACDNTVHSYATLTSTTMNGTLLFNEGYNPDAFYSNNQMTKAQIIETKATDTSLLT